MDNRVYEIRHEDADFRRRIQALAQDYSDFKYRIDVLSIELGIDPSEIVEDIKIEDGIFNWAGGDDD